MKILAIGASNNRKSINRALAVYSAGIISGVEVDTLQADDFELPLFSDERERLLGQPGLAREFYRRIGEADALVISFAEHNGGYCAAYKNLLDWTSRIDRALFQNKAAAFLATSPGPGGANRVLALAADSAEYFGARLVSMLSVPRFEQIFDWQRRVVTHRETRGRLERMMLSLLKSAPETSQPESGRKAANLRRR